MPPASGGSRSARRSKTAIDASDNGVVINITGQPGASGPSNPVQQPQAQQPGSRSGCAAPNEGVQSNLTHQADTQASSRKRRSSEDVSTQKPKRAKRNRRAEGLPPNYCFQCEEEHPWPDEDGTTYHTRLLSRKRSRERDEHLQDTTATATRDSGQQPPSSILERLGNDPSFKESFQTEIREADTNGKRLGKLLTMFDSTRADGELLAQGISPVAHPPSARAPANTYAMAASGPAQGTYQFPSQAPWPSQPARGGRGEFRGRESGRGNQKRGGRGGHSNPPGQQTTPATNVAQAQAATTAAQRPATSVAPAANNAAQTGRQGQSQSAHPASRHSRGERTLHQSSSPAGLGLARGRGRGRGEGRGGGSSA